VGRGEKLFNKRGENLGSGQKEVVKGSNSRLNSLRGGEKGLMGGALGVPQCSLLFENIEKKKDRKDPNK